MWVILNLRYCGPVNFVVAFLAQNNAPYYRILFVRVLQCSRILKRGTNQMNKKNGSIKSKFKQSNAIPSLYPISNKT